MSATRGALPGPRIFVLLGRPVAHSLSPDLHGAAFRELGAEAVYGALEAAEDEVAPAMRLLARSGGGGNVTVPHKERAAAALDRASAAVRATGACNCFWGTDDGELAGDNTDVAGFLAAVSELVPGEDGLEGLEILILGAGGAARAVLHACLRSGAARVDLLNRTRSRAEAVAREVGDDEGRIRVLGDRAEADARYGLVVNATSLGVDESDPLPLDLGELEVRAAFDLVYGPEGTAWVRHARRLGIPARDGLTRRMGERRRNDVHGRMTLAELVALVHFERRPGGPVQKGRDARTGGPARSDHRDRPRQHMLARAQHRMAKAQRLGHLGFGRTSDDGADAVRKNESGLRPDFWWHVLRGRAAREGGELAQILHG